ncbi:MAG: archease [Brevefilum sp.]
MKTHGYHEVDHTADIALRVWAEDFLALLRQAAKGLYALMGAEPRPGSSEQLVFTIPSGNQETVLVDFLNELLFLAEDNGIILDQFSFEEGYENIEVESTGKRLLSQERVIKAVTFHDLCVEKMATGYQVTITFDV